MSDTVLAASLLIAALREAGVKYIFANLGSDHPAIIEALAIDRERGITTPSVIICPHEYSALSAAHGYAAVTGEPQAVFVHTDVGTANLGGAVHNAARSRAPVFIFAGLTPVTMEGEMPGTRNNIVNHLQDPPDQHAIVRQYVKWSYDIRTGRNLPQLVHRGLQLAMSAPAGPVYLTGAREVLAEEVPAPAVAPSRFPTVARAPAPTEVVDELIADLRAARRPVIVTSYLGRRQDAVASLVTLAERLAVPVVEFNPEVLNFPHDHGLHLGNNPHPIIAEADVVVALDTDAPWIPATAQPPEGAKVYIVNEDPLQETIPLWYLPADRLLRADGGLLLEAMLERSAGLGEDDALIRRAEGFAAEAHEFRTAAADEALADVSAQRLTAASVAHVLDGLIDEDTIVINESISSSRDVWKNVPRRRAGTLFNNRGTSLGWSGGGALGVKLAHPDRTVVSFVGDGTFYFTVPSSTYWIADRYGLPVLTIVLDNGGWNATKNNLQLQHPGQHADQGDRYWVNLQQSGDLPGIATAAGGAWGRTVADFAELEDALKTGLSQVAAGRSAVVAVKLAPISRQPEDALAAAAAEASAVTAAVR